MAAGTLKCLEMLERDTSLRDHLEEITVGYRQALKDAGFDIIDGTHPCVPIMLYDEHKAARMAQKLYELGIYAVSFTYPVVPKGRAAPHPGFLPPTPRRTWSSPSAASSRPARQMEEEDAKA